MRILIASDKFKGSLTAAEACDAIATGLREGITSDRHEIRCLPIADGGDGIAETLTAAAGGEWIDIDVTGPLGDRVSAGYGLIDAGKTAVIEMASASGLALLGDQEKDPLRASTFGTGELILDAVSRGASAILLRIGGSATNDGGTGMALALGFRFFDEEDRELTSLPEALGKAVRFLPPDQFHFPSVTVACDVSNPLLGPKGCTAIYGPQKGITPDTFAVHEARLGHLVEMTGPLGKAAAEQPGAGAAGGLGFGAIVFLGADLVPGFDLVANHLGLAEAIESADLVITGEGRLDHQSLEGKGPFGVVKMARRKGKSTAAFCGSLANDTLEATFGPISEIRDPDLSLAENMTRGAEHLRSAARRFAATLCELDAE